MLPDVPSDHSARNSLAREFLDLDELALESPAAPVVPPAETTSAVADLDAKAATPPRSFVDRFFQPLSLAKAAFLLGLAVLFPYLVQRLPNLGARPEYRVQTHQIQLVPAPERPVPSDLLEQVTHQSDFPRELSVLDPKLSQKLASAFATNPWIERVISVKQSFPAAVVVEVEYRRPVAMIQVKGGRLPIDARGAVLPSRDFSTEEALRYPTIREVGENASKSDGVVWKDAELVAAARVAELLLPKWNELKLDAIELPHRATASRDVGDIRLELRTRDGSRIIWGRTPGSKHPGELTPEQKIGRLEKYLAEFGGFDRPNGPYEIDIRHWQEITRRQLEKPQAATRRDPRTRR